MTQTPNNGVLLVDKPAGRTSHEVVAAARRALGERRIGHWGTLDPFATGLLVLLVGRATRLAPYVMGEPKVYDVVIAFGTETDTDDVTGAPTRAAAQPDEVAVRTALGALTGTLTQEPPAYSAKQVAGVRAYAAARRGRPLALQPVTVTVHEWQVRSMSGASLDARVICSAGTYVRALARDLGRAVGSAAHVSALRRTRSGPYDVADALTVDALEGASGRLRSPIDGLGPVAVQALDDAEAAAVRHGRGVPVRIDTAERAALVDGEHNLIAIAERRGELWSPRVVLQDA